MFWGEQLLESYRLIEQIKKPDTAIPFSMENKQAKKVAKMGHITILDIEDNPAKRWKKSNKTNIWD